MIYIRSFLSYRNGNKATGCTTKHRNPNQIPGQCVAKNLYREIAELIYSNFKQSLLLSNIPACNIHFYFTALMDIPVN